MMVVVEVVEELLAWNNHLVDGGHCDVLEEPELELELKLALVQHTHTR
jgi:hypothetical protein